MYPEKLSGFFEFIQVILLDLDDGRKQLKPKLQALKNELELSSKVNLHLLSAVSKQNTMWLAS